MSFSTQILDVGPRPLGVIDHEGRTKVRQALIEDVVKDVKQASGVERRRVHKVAATVRQLEVESVIYTKVIPSGCRKVRPRHARDEEDGKERTATIHGSLLGLLLDAQHPKAPSGWIPNVRVLVPLTHDRITTQPPACGEPTIGGTGRETQRDVIRQQLDSHNPLTRSKTRNLTPENWREVYVHRRPQPCGVILDQGVFQLKRPAYPGTRSSAHDSSIIYERCVNAINGELNAPRTH